MRRLTIQWLTSAIFVSGTCTLVMGADEALLGMERFDSLKQIGNVNPKRSEDILASPWGIQFNKHDLPMELMDVFLERMAESGVKWARVETRSYIIEHGVSKLIETKGKDLGDKERLFYYNTEGIRAQGGIALHRQMVEAGIPHRYCYETKRKHRWDSGWMPLAVEFLVED